MYFVQYLILKRQYRSLARWELLPGNRAGGQFAGQFVVGDHSADSRQHLSSNGTFDPSFPAKTYCGVATG